MEGVYPVGDEVRRELLIPADPDEVWSALTDPRGLREWFADEAMLELEPGGEARFRLPDGEERSGFVEEVAAPERLRFWWRPADDPEAPLTRVEFTLTESGQGTLLRVIESRPVVSLEAMLSPSFEPGRGVEGPQMRAGSSLSLVA
jgi:uncharacterized protein YndB with AHSA1/START domain